MWMTRNAIFIASVNHLLTSAGQATARHARVTEFQLPRRPGMAGLDRENSLEPLLLAQVIQPEREEEAQNQRAGACSDRRSRSTFSEQAREELEPVLIGKVDQLFRNRLESGMRKK
jgi:hypothetical protein